MEECKEKENGEGVDKRVKLILTVSSLKKKPAQSSVSVIVYLHFGKGNREKGVQTDMLPAELTWLSGV